MKKIICFILAVLMCLSLFGCGSSSGRSTKSIQAKSVDDVLKERAGEDAQTTEASAGAQSKKQTGAVPTGEGGAVDIDLTKLSSTLVYSEVYNMMSSPEDYVGKRVRMKGPFTYTEGDGRYYFACIISDATACCAQGIEFVLKDQRNFPDDYPEAETEITVSGVFDTYYEGSNRYCQLIDAVMEQC